MVGGVLVIEKLVLALARKGDSAEITGCHVTPSLHRRWWRKAISQRANSDDVDVKACRPRRVCLFASLPQRNARQRCSLRHVSSSYCAEKQAVAKEAGGPALECGSGFEFSIWAAPPNRGSHPTQELRVLHLNRTRARRSTSSVCAALG